MSTIVVNLQDNRAVFRIFIALLRFSFDSPSYVITTRRKGLRQGIHDIPVTVGQHKIERTSQRLRVLKLTELQPQFTAQHTKYRQGVATETFYFVFLSHTSRVLVSFYDIDYYIFISFYFKDKVFT